MSPELINEGLRLEKEATKGPWFYDGICYLFSGNPHDAQMVADNRETIQMRGVGANLPLEINADLIVFLRNHAVELLECARRCAEMEKEIESLKEFEWKYNGLCK